MSKKSDKLVIQTKCYVGTYPSLVKKSYGYQTKDENTLAHRATIFFDDVKDAGKILDAVNVARGWDAKDEARQVDAKKVPHTVYYACEDATELPAEVKKLKQLGLVNIDEVTNGDNKWYLKDHLYINIKQNYNVQVADENLDDVFEEVTPGSKVLMQLTVSYADGKFGPRVYISPTHVKLLGETSSLEMPQGGGDNRPVAEVFADFKD